MKLYVIVQTVTYNTYTDKTSIRLLGAYKIRQDAIDELNKMYQEYNNYENIPDNGFPLDVMKNSLKNNVLKTIIGDLTYTCTIKVTDIKDYFL